MDFRRGEVVIYTGTAEGSVCRLRLQVPVSPGAAVADIKVQGRDVSHARSGQIETDLPGWSSLVQAQFSVAVLHSGTLVGSGRGVALGVHRLLR